MLQNKGFKTAIKISIGLLLFFWMAYSLYHQISRQPDLNRTLSELSANWKTTGWYFILLVSALMVVNWLIEAIKWKTLLKGTERLSLLRSFQSVLTGVAVSMITPNRIGEYLGRIMYLRNVHKVQGITVTIVGSFAQLIVTGFLGMSGLVYYACFIQSSYWLMILLLGSVILSSFLTYFYFHFHKIVDWSTERAMFKKIKIYLLVLRRFNQRLLLRILFLSLLRYLVYTLQFYLLLQFFLVKANGMDLIFSIWLIFWAMAIVPSIAIAEIGIRSETAVFFLLPLSSNQLGIISASTFLWCINLVIPSLIGCLFVYKIRIYDDE